MISLDNILDEKELIKVARLTCGLIVPTSPADDFISFVESMGKPNRLSLKLYEKVKEYCQNVTDDDPSDECGDVHSEEDNAILSKLSKIQLSEIQYYVPDYSSASGFAIRLGIRNLCDLYTAKALPLDKANGVRLLNWQNFLYENVDLIISNWELVTSEREFPAALDYNANLTDNLWNAFSETVKHWIRIDELGRFNGPLQINGKKCNKQTLLDITKQVILEGKSTAEVEIARVSSGEGIEGPWRMFRSAFVNGIAIDSKFKINAELLSQLKAIRNEIIYTNIDSVIPIHASEQQIDFLFKCLELDSIEFMGETFIIGSGEKGDIAEVLKCLNGGKGFLRKSASPMSRDEILEACSIDTLSDADSDLEKLIDNITHCDRIFESVGDSSFLLRNDRLFTIAQKISRYVYQHGPVSTDGIRTGCKEEYGLELGTIDSSTLKPFGVNFKGAFWEYGNEGNAGMPLRTATKEIATEKVNFTFNDVIDELSRRYHKSDFNELSIRAYITDICNVDNKDPQHFCLKEKTGDYPETSWRQSSRMDLINWILNQVKNALEKGKCKFSEVERYVLSKSSELSDNTHIQARFRWVMKLYSGEGKPFIVIDDTIVRNGATYDATDFDIIGKKGGKLPFHKQIRAIIANELKTVKKIPLVACVGIVNDIMSSAFSRSDILRALQNNELGVATFDVANEGSGVFVIRTDVGEKIVEAKSEPRTPDIIDFIKSLLQREYVILFRQLETDANSAAEKFITYITSSKNSNISSRLYKNIQEFSQADIDEDDAYVYLTNLCLFFEGLLSEIYRTTAPGHTVKGLMAIANRFEYLRDIPTIYPARRNRIESAYISLRDNRNKIAHGEPVEVSKEDAMKLIQDYIVLYAYIVAKYASIR